MSDLSPKEIAEIEALLGLQEAQIHLDELCFPKQLAFLEDPNLFVTAMTSRRAGKTTACALDLLYTAWKNPKMVCLYITLARTNAKKIIWPMLQELNEDLGLNAEVNQSDLSLRLSNKSMIYCSGAATSSEIVRFLGLALKLVYVDEAQDFGTYLEQLVNRVLVPACFDNKGKIKLIGTPPPVPVGYFIDSHSSSEWSHHHWTMFDNPWIEKKRGESPQVILEQELKRRGVDESDPTIQREVFGRCVVDSRRLVIEYDSRRNHYDTLPAGSLYYLIGIDLGYQDADAVVVLGYGDNSPTTYLVDELVTPKQGLTELIRQVEQLRGRYAAHRLVIDTGGLGLKIAEEMRRRYSIPVVAAEKTRKFENIELFNDSLRTGRFLARKESRFASDAMLLEWDMDKLRPDRKVISERFHSDIIDATLYAFRESPAYSYKEPPPKLKPYSPEWYLKQEEEMEQNAINQARQSKYDDLFNPLCGFGEL